MKRLSFSMAPKGRRDSHCHGNSSSAARFAAGGKSGAVRGFTREAALEAIEEDSQERELVTPDIGELLQGGSAAASSELEESLRDFSIEDARRRHFGIAEDDISIQNGRRLLEKLGIPNVDADRFVAAMGQNDEASYDLLDALENYSDESMRKTYYGVPETPVGQEEARWIVDRMGILWNDVRALEKK